jgi:hypothetical protein
MKIHTSFRSALNQIPLTLSGELLHQTGRDGTVATLSAKPRNAPANPLRPKPAGLGQRLALWWTGEARAEDDDPGDTLASVDTTPASPVCVRIAALEALWGAGRLQPGWEQLDNAMIEKALGGPSFDGEIGFIGVDPATINAFRERCGHGLRALEWRKGCAERFRSELAGVILEEGPIDRPRTFADSSLCRLISVDGVAFADHKAGLVSRAWRALSASGRWLCVETVRRSPKTPVEPFATAWAEPQLAEEADLVSMMEAAGFAVVENTCMTDRTIEAAREGYGRLAGQLDAVVAAGMEGRSGALLLQELAWEAHSWRARVRALEGGALAVRSLVVERA